MHHVIYSGGVRDHLPAAGRAQRDGACQPRLRDPFGGDLQRADHRRADPARAQGRAGTARSARRRCLRRNFLVYGLGGLVVPFIGIKLIDLMLVAMHAT